MCGIRVVYGRYTAVYGGPWWYTDGIRTVYGGIRLGSWLGIRTVYGGIRVASCNLLIFAVKKVRVTQDWRTYITSTLGA